MDKKFCWNPLTVAAEPLKNQPFPRLVTIPDLASLCQNAASVHGGPKNFRTIEAGCFTWGCNVVKLLKSKTFLLPRRVIMPNLVALSRTIWEPLFIANTL